MTPDVLNPAPDGATDPQRDFYSRVLTAYKGGTIKRGSGRSKTVRALQLFLRDQGFAISADGIPGGETEAALKEWQKREGLAADGKAGRQVFDRIRATVTPTPRMKPAAAEEANPEPGEEPPGAPEDDGDLTDEEAAALDPEGADYFKTPAADPLLDARGTASDRERERMNAEWEGKYAAQRRAAAMPPPPPAMTGPGGSPAPQYSPNAMALDAILPEGMYTPRALPDLTTANSGEASMLAPDQSVYDGAEPSGPAFTAEPAMAPTDPLAEALMRKALMARGRVPMASAPATDDVLAKALLAQGGG